MTVPDRRASISKSGRGQCRENIQEEALTELGNQADDEKLEEGEVGNTGGVVISCFTWEKAAENLFTFENI